MDYRSQILRLAETYCEATGRSEARVATLVHNQGRFFSNLRAGRGCTMDTFGKALQWFSDHWPDETSWPEGIDRPPVQAAPSSDAAGRAA